MNKEKVKEIFDELKRIGEEKTFSETEIERMQTFFKAGKLSKTICWLGWAKYYDDKGDFHYTENFPKEVEDIMTEIYYERIKSVKSKTEDLYNNFSLQQCADFLNKEFKKMAKFEPHSKEYEQMVKTAKESVADVEIGKLVREGNIPTYESIIVRTNGWYSGQIIIKKSVKGYYAECKAPLAGGMCCEIPQDEIFRYLKHIAKYLCS